jgi:hypothetical protein
MGAICSLTLSCKQSAKYKNSRSIISVLLALCKEVVHWPGPGFAMNCCGETAELGTRLSKIPLAGRCRCLIKYSG